MLISQKKVKRCIDVMLLSYWESFRRWFWWQIWLITRKNFLFKLFLRKNLPKKQKIPPLPLYWGLCFLSWENNDGYQVRKQYAIIFHLILNVKIHFHIIIIFLTFYTSSFSPCSAATTFTSSYIFFHKIITNCICIQTLSHYNILYLYVIFNLVCILKGEEEK